MTTLRVADIRANLNENIVHAARILGRSKARRQVFAAIYRGKKKAKTVGEISRSTGLNRVRVLQEGAKLAGNGIVEQVKLDGQTAYQKDRTYVHHKTRIIDLSLNPQKQSKYPTKQNPRGSSLATYKVTVRAAVQPQEITVDDIDSFSKIRGIAAPISSIDLRKTSEAHIKNAFRGIIGEDEDFKDWGGEKNDLFTNKLVFRGRRRSAAFALKGKATQGILTPAKMGKNGDQIERLLGSEADLFLVVYHSKIDQSIYAQMRAYALGKAIGGRRVFCGVIDGGDLNRLRQAYGKYF